MIGQERFDEGTDLLRDLPENERQQAASLTVLVQTYLREGKAEEARAFLDDLLAKNPENLQALGLRGNLHLAEGRAGRGEGALRKDPGDLDPKNVGRPFGDGAAGRDRR